MENKGEVLNESYKYPSRYKVPQSVDLDFDGTRISGCITEAVRFTEDKVRYDILIPVRSGEEVLYTKIENVDSVFVVDPI